MCAAVNASAVDANAQPADCSGGFASTGATCALQCPSDYVTVGQSTGHCSADPGQTTASYKDVAIACVPGRNQPSQAQHCVYVCL